MVFEGYMMQRSGDVLSLIITFYPATYHETTAFDGQPV